MQGIKSYESGFTGSVHGCPLTAVSVPLPLRNAQAYVPTKTIQPQVTQGIRDIFNAPHGGMAKIRLKYHVEKYAESAPQLAAWMEANLPEGLTVFERPESHCKRRRMTNMLERLHEEINRRTRAARLFPNEASLLRLISVIETETGAMCLVSPLS